MKKYLNEEQYQATKKKFVIITNIVLVVGLLLAVILLVCGIEKKSNPGTSKYNVQIETLQQEIATLNEQIHNEFIENGFSSQYYTLSYQIDDKEEQLSELDQKVSILEHVYIYLWVSSGFVFLLTTATVGALYVWIYQRNIKSFEIQSTMPIAQESLDTLAPTIGKVGEEIAKGISKGRSEETSKDGK